MTFLYFLADSINGMLMQLPLLIGRDSPRGLIIRYETVERFPVFVLLDGNTLHFILSDPYSVPLLPKEQFVTCRSAIMEAKQRHLDTNENPETAKPESIRTRIRLFEGLFDMRDIERKLAAFVLLLPAVSDAQQCRRSRQ